MESERAASYKVQTVVKLFKIIITISPPYTIGHSADTVRTGCGPCTDPIQIAQICLDIYIIVLSNIPSIEPTLILTKYILGFVVCGCLECFFLLSGFLVVIFTGGSAGPGI